MQSLQRVNLLLEKRQHAALKKLARLRNRSVSDLAREYIAAGLKQDDRRREERLLALENARALKARIAKRRKNKRLTNLIGILEQVRSERTDEVLGRGR